MIASSHTSLTFRDSIVCILSRPVAHVCRSALAVTHQELVLLTAAVTARYLLTTESVYTFPGFSPSFFLSLIFTFVLFCNSKRR